MNGMREGQTLVGVVEPKIRFYEDLANPKINFNHEQRFNNDQSENQYAYTGHALGNQNALPGSDFQRKAAFAYTGQALGNQNALPGSDFQRKTAFAYTGWEIRMPCRAAIFKEMWHLPSR